MTHVAPAGLILQQGGQSVPLPLQVLNIAPLRHDIDPGEKVAPDVAQQLFRRKGFRADGIHRVEVHTKHRLGEEEQEQSQTERGIEFGAAPAGCQPVCQVLHGQPASAAQGSAAFFFRKPVRKLCCFLALRAGSSPARSGGVV